MLIVRLLTQVCFKSGRKADVEFSLSSLSDAHGSIKTNVGTLAQARAEARRALSVAKRDVDIYIFILSLHARSVSPVVAFKNRFSRPLVCDAA